MNGLAILSFISFTLFSLLGLFVLIEGSKKRKSFFWLGLFFFLLGFNFLDGGLLFSDFYRSNPHFILWEDPFLLVYGPSIYFFAKGYQSNAIWNRSYIFHLLPFVAALLGVCYFHYQSTTDIKIETLRIISSPTLSFSTALGFIPIFGHLIGYMLVARKSLRRAGRTLKQYYSSLEISWAIESINLFLILIVFSVASTFLRISPNSSLQVLALGTVILIAIFSIARLLAKGLKQPIFAYEAKTELSYSLNEAESEQLFDKLKSALHTGLHRNPDLTLKELAKQIGENERSVSYVINKVGGKNFYDFVNQYRINEATELLINPSDAKMTVLEIMYRVGFNSKSSFNTQFKKKTGLSPSEYRKKKK